MLRVMRLLQTDVSVLQADLKHGAVILYGRDI